MRSMNSDLLLPPKDTKKIDTKVELSDVEKYDRHMDGNDEITTSLKDLYKRSFSTFSDKLKEKSQVLFP